MASADTLMPDLCNRKGSGWSLPSDDDILSSSLSGVAEDD